MSGERKCVEHSRAIAEVEESMPAAAGPVYDDEIVVRIGLDAHVCERNQLPHTTFYPARSLSLGRARWLEDGLPPVIL